MQEIKLNGWVAEDEDGKQCLYTNKPEIRDSWWQSNDEAYCPLPMQLDLGPDWKKSLRQVINNVVQEPRPELKIDDPVLVRAGESQNWLPRYFAGWGREGNIQTFLKGRTSFSKESTDLASWTFYKLPETPSNE